MKDNRLESIPYVGKSIAKDFLSIGIKKVSDLKRRDPEKMYLQICAKRHAKIDRCVLYVCRSSVYFANHNKHNPEKLKWWNWKDRKLK
jgi:hypothetical protein